jgi:hypothetical protein
MASLERENLTIEFSWVKARIGIFGNELADQLAKTSANDNEGQIPFTRIPISTVKRIRSKTKMAEGMGRENEGCNNKRVLSRSARQAKIKNSHKTSLHSDCDGPRKNQGLYPSRLNLEHATCPCGKREQTIDHLLNQCLILHTQREIFKGNVLKSGNWPPRKREIISKHLKSFQLFIKSNFDLL